MTESRVGSIGTIRSQEWAKNRDKPGTFRKLMREEADSQPRQTICGFCGAESPMLTGPEGRAWFKAHTCKKTHLRLVAS